MIDVSRSHAYPADHSALRIALAVGGAFAGLLVIVAALRPEMMGVAPMIRRLIVGFGL